MRAFVLIILFAFLNATTLAVAGEPGNPPPYLPLPSDSLTTDLPSAINSELPDLSSPANSIATKQELYEVGYSVMMQLRDQRGLFEVILFPDAYDTYGGLVYETRAMRVTGVKSSNDSVSATVEPIAPLFNFKPRTKPTPTLPVAR